MSTFYLTLFVSLVFLHQSQGTIIQKSLQTQMLAQTEGADLTKAIDMSDYVGETIGLAVYGGLYITPQTPATTQLKASAYSTSSIVLIEWFMTQNSDGSYSLSSNAYGSYMRGQSDTKVLASATISSNEKWIFYYGSSDGRYCIKNQATNTYLTYNPSSSLISLSSTCSTSYNKFQVKIRSNNAYMSSIAGMKVALQVTRYSTYLKADDDYSAVRQSKDLTDGQTFYLEQNDDRTFSLLSYYGSYIRCQYSSSVNKCSQTTSITSSEKWQFVLVDTDTWVLRNQANGCYLSYGGSGDNVDLTYVQLGTAIGGRETLKIVLLSKEDYVQITLLTDSASVGSSTPLAVSTQILNNTLGSEDQSMTFHFLKTLAATKTFEQTVGYEVSVTTTVAWESNVVFSAASGEVSVAVSNYGSWTYGSENYEEVTFEAEQPLVVPAGTAMKCIATVTQTELDIPYIGIVHYVGTSATKTVYGTFKSVSYYNLNTEIRDL